MTRAKVCIDQSVHALLSAFLNLAVQCPVLGTWAERKLLFLLHNNAGLTTNNHLPLFKMNIVCSS